jgi:predicted nucleotidyltransferase
LKKISENLIDLISFQQINTNSNPKCNEVIEKIKEKLPLESTLVYVAIVGGRAKGITNEDSDYDTISIYLNPLKRYIL